MMKNPGRPPKEPPRVKGDMTDAQVDADLRAAAKWRKGRRKVTFKKVALKCYRFQRRMT